MSLSMQLIDINVVRSIRNWSARFVSVSPLWTRYTDQPSGGAQPIIRSDAFWRLKKDDTSASANTVNHVPRSTAIARIEMVRPTIRFFNNCIRAIPHYLHRLGFGLRMVTRLKMYFQTPADCLPKCVHSWLRLK